MSQISAPQPKPKVQIPKEAEEAIARTRKNIDALEAPEMRKFLLKANVAKTETEIERLCADEWKDGTTIEALVDKLKQFDAGIRHEIETGKIEKEIDRLVGKAEEIGRSREDGEVKAMFEKLVRTFRKKIAEDVAEWEKEGYDPRERMRIEDYLSNFERQLREWRA